MKLRHGQAAEEPSTSTDSTTNTTDTGNAASTADTGTAADARGAADTADTSSSAATEREPQAQPPAPAPSADVGSALDEVGESALRLLSGLPRPPSALSIEANGVSIQIEWAAGPSAAPAMDHGQPPAGGGQAVAATLTQPMPGTADAGRPASGGVRPTSGTGGAAEPGPDSSRHYLRSPAVGVLFRSPSPGAKPFVEVGDSVVAGQQVAIVEVMKLMIPVKADTDGRVVEVLKENAEPVEYDEPLLAIAPLSN